MNTQFQKLNEILDNEIKAYTKLKAFFEEKRDSLKSSKPDDLGVLDNKILALNNQITKLNNERMDVATELGKSDANMSWFIEKAEEQAPEYVEVLKDKKVKICKLISELTLLNNQNVELLKHGIIISNKMFETVINAFATQVCFYNGAGKTDTHDVDMWTINEEI